MNKKADALNMGRYSEKDTGGVKDEQSFMSVRRKISL